MNGQCYVLSVVCALYGGCRRTYIYLKRVFLYWYYFRVTVLLLEIFILLTKFFCLIISKSMRVYIYYLSIMHVNHAFTARVRVWV